MPIGSSGLLYDLPRAGSPSLDSECDISLAADRVYLFYQSPGRTVRSYRTRFIFSLAGSFVSVALSLELLPVAVSNCLAHVLSGLSSVSFRGTVTNYQSDQMRL